MAILSLPQEELERLAAEPLAVVDSYGFDVYGEKNYYDFGGKVRFLNWPIAISIFHSGARDGSSEVSYHVDCPSCSGACTPDLWGAVKCRLCGRNVTGLRGHSEIPAGYAVPLELLDSLAESFHRMAVESGGDALAASILADAGANALGSLFFQGVQLTRGKTPTETYSAWNNDVARAGRKLSSEPLHGERVPAEFGMELLRG